jgi:hypothetical protein
VTDQVTLSIAKPHYNVMESRKPFVINREYCIFDINFTVCFDVNARAYNDTNNPFSPFAGANFWNHCLGYEGWRWELWGGGLYLIERIYREIRSGLQEIPRLSELCAIYMVRIS